MNGTTFPSYPGQEQQTQQHSFGTQYGDNTQSTQSSGNSSNYGGNKPWQKKPWQNNNQGGNGGQGGWQKKPWQGGNKRPEDMDLTLYKPYACISNADCPSEIQEKFTRIVKKLEELSYTVRVGGMDAVDELIEKTTEKKEVHLPWRDFNEKQSKFTYNSERAFAVAKMFHPTFDTMKKGIQCFLAKNARLVLGDKMNSPALFLICWTEDGVESGKMKTNRTGFAGHPISIASAIGIPIFNLAKADAEDRINFLVEGTRNG